MTQTTQTQSGGLPEVFNYNDQAVRLVTVNDEPWFVLADVCRVLGITQPRHFLKSKQCDQDGVRQAYPIVDSLGRTQETTLINEPNLYAIVLRSDKDESLKFQRWITHEVLPAIRKHGRYANALDIPSDPFLASLENTRMLYLNQQELLRRQNDVENRLGKIEIERDQAKEALSALPEPTVELRELSTREKCRQAVDAFAVASGLSHRDAWRKVYYDYDYEKSTKLTVKARNAKLGKLEYIEKHGDIEALYALILKLTNNARRAS